jgi:hypothetical protein
VPYDIRRLGWQIGARDPSFEYLDSFIEVKRPYRNPEHIRCYKFVRYGLWLEDDGPGPRDLADSEARRGHVFLPLDDRSVVTRLISYWRRFLELLERLNKDIRDPGLAMGSRMALHYGAYLYGRIGFRRSFAPTFDGASVVEVARLEQGLSLAVKGGGEPGADAGDPVAAIRGQRHVLAVSDAA